MPMAIYCVDTSSLIAAWQERYPIENFPSFWRKIEDLIKGGRLVAPIEVLHETSKRSDDLYAWLKARNTAFYELDDEVQVAAAMVLGRFPRLVGERKLRTSADPFVIAMAHVQELQIITDEKPTGSLARPNIPDVCAAMGMTWFGLLEMIRAEKWVIG
ncbi:MAG: DUF4411 family protein [Azospirillaceae bacterium]|nr:DUF4411 family protein [Azospirillaceae bacterium]